jgi:GNAT superfamily N-acetyltransferase
MNNQMPERKINISFDDTCIEFEELWELVYSTEGLVVFDARLYPSYIIIDLLQIAHKQRRQGKGTKILNQVISFAQKHGKDILLLVDETFGTPKDVLFNFYSKFGFVPNKKYHAKEWKDYLIYEPPK